MTQKKKKKHSHHDPYLVVGTLRVHPRGFGFLVPDDKERFPQDIFIPKRDIHGAVDGDTVEVKINPNARSDKGPDGQVTKVIHRGRSHLAGIITYVDKKGGGYAYAPMLGDNQQIQIKQTKSRKLKLGDRLIIHVIHWGNKHGGDLLGEMSAYIGHISDPACDVSAAIEEFDLDADFPSEVIEEAQHFGDKVTDKDLVNREDFRQIECFTIDPETAKDFDDALSLTKDKEGNFYLGVHIADVSHYVHPGSHLDGEADARCNSTYFPGRVLPMLPHELSSHLCSLKPNVDRLTVSVLMTIDKRGKLVEYEICKGVICSQQRFSYEEAKEVLDGKRKSKHSKTLKAMVELCHLLKKQRYERGSIEFALPDISLQLDKKGMPTHVEVVEYDITHQLVEEFMLKANEVVATTLSEEGKPLTYRIHDEPNPEKIRDFAATATSLGFQISDEPTIEELQELFDQVRSSPFGQFLATCFIRSMKLANYSTQNIGHYGLSLEHYTHFTSPIRRYIDLVIHRLLFDEIETPEDELEQVALKCSEKERLSSRAENSVLQLKKLRLLHKRLDENNTTFMGVITGINPAGLVFELTELLYEGFIPFSYYGKKFLVGDKIEVELVDVDLIERTVEWTHMRANRR